MDGTDASKGVAGERGDKVRFYFACVGNSGRSQMAEAFCRALGTKAVECASGGSVPYGEVLDVVAEAMDEVGIDLSGHESTPLDADYVRGCDLVVTMGCGEDACPAFHEVEVEDWALEDPKGKDLEAVRAIREDIEARVRGLLERYDVLT